MLTAPGTLNSILKQAQLKISTEKIENQEHQEDIENQEEN